MNNPKWLEGSLGSIRAHTSLPCEVFVVAYLFSPENLAAVRKAYPWVEFVESNEIRGFSENNNLALRRARGKYCFVVNDDTYWDEPVIDELVACFDRLPPDAAVVSPTLRWPDRTVQFCGRLPSSLVRYACHCFALDRLYRPACPEAVDQKGLFPTRGLSGACFLAKTEALAACGWFDERFFFCPEDAVLGERLESLGWHCYAFEPATVFHLAGGTMHVSDTILATKPAAVRGIAISWADRGLLPLAVYRVLSIFNFAWRSLAWFLAFLATRRPRAKLMACANRNALAACMSGKTPKQLFLRYYGKAGA
jgi:GT2 family glycosyltransferase